MSYIQNPFFFTGVNFMISPIKFLGYIIVPPPWYNLDVSSYGKCNWFNFCLKFYLCKSLLGFITSHHPSLNRNGIFPVTILAQCSKGGRYFYVLLSCALSYQIIACILLAWAWFVLPLCVIDCVILCHWVSKRITITQILAMVFITSLHILLCSIGDRHRHHVHYLRLFILGYWAASQPLRGVRGYWVYSKRRCVTPGYYHWYPGFNR